MTRHFLLVAILGLLPAPLAAEEKVTRLADQEDFALALALIPDGEKPNGAADQGDVAGRNTDGIPHDEALPLGNADSTCENERGFHPACDCGCHIGCLDHWCPCELPCCSTDCWVEYPCQCSHGNCYRTEDGRWVSNDACCDVWGPPLYRSDSAVRFGWWTIGNQGSQTKTGEFQDLQSSPFYNVDAISSDGVRTWDVGLSGLDNEDSDARVRYYGPDASAKVNYQRYLRRLDHDRLAGYDLDNPVPPGPNDNVVTNDLNVGEDYAIRVETLNAKFQGRLTDDLKWRLNLWGQRKFGERQTNAIAHCFDLNAPAPPGADGNVCHVLSQSQSIDWLTMEIQPVVEAKFENATVEYSHTMRSFSQDDQAVTRQYTHFNNFSPNNNTLGPDYDYALVPDNLTQIDRLKVSANLTDDNQLYANLYVGNTKNEFRDTQRNMNGYDLRLINSSLDEITLTGYASRYGEDNELPSTFLTSPPLSPTPVPPATQSYDELSLRHPINYTRTRAGIKGRWQPYEDQHSCYPGYGLSDGTSLAWGYEYYQLEREFATFNTTPVPPGPFSQPDTITHQIQFGPATRWSRTLDTYTRYKVQFIHVPLIGVSEYSDEDPDINGAFNTKLPEQVHSVEIGGTWTPTDNFMTTAQFTIENSWHRSQYANFSENNYPIVCTVWYAPTNRLSLTSGYAYFSNWIDQDITLGANRGIPTDTETTRWNYAGEDHLVSFNAAYAWTECVQLVAGYEWNRGNNAFNLPPSQQAGVDWTLLPSLSDVIVETNRVTAGVDWQPDRNWNLYLRYIFSDYNDIASGLDSGTSHMALAGAGVNW